MATTSHPTTTEPEAGGYNVPVQEVDYSKGTTYPTTGYPATGTTSTAYNPPAATGGLANYAALKQAVPNVTIFLRPIAAPSALGWMGFFGGTFCVFTWLASWYGSGSSYFDLAPFVFFFGGLCQLVAGFYGFAARDNFATVFFTLWGSFYLAWSSYMVFLFPMHFLNTSGGGGGGGGGGTTNPSGLTPLLVDVDKFAHDDGLGMWFVILCAVSWACFLASLARDMTTALITLLTAIGATLELAYFSSRGGMVQTIKAGCYFLIVASLIAGFRSLLYLLEEGFYESPYATRFLPTRRSPLLAEERAPVTVGVNEPGVKKGE